MNLHPIIAIMLIFLIFAVLLTFIAARMGGRSEGVAVVLVGPFPLILKGRNVVLLALVAAAIVLAVLLVMF